MSEKLKKKFRLQLSKVGWINTHWLHCSIGKAFDWESNGQKFDSFHNFWLKYLSRNSKSKKQSYFCWKLFAEKFFFLRRKNTDTREKIQQGWKEKGAPFRSDGAKRRIQGVSKRKKSCGAKRRIQGCYISGSKEKWGCFLIKILLCSIKKNLTVQSYCKNLTHSEKFLQ